MNHGGSSFSTLKQQCKHRLVTVRSKNTSTMRFRKVLVKDLVTIRKSLQHRRKSGQPQHIYSQPLSSFFLRYSLDLTSCGLPLLQRAVHQLLWQRCSNEHHHQQCIFVFAGGDLQMRSLLRNRCRVSTECLLCSPQCRYFRRL